MVERQLPKLHTRVRFPSPAPCPQLSGSSYASGTPSLVAGVQPARDSHRVFGTRVLQPVGLHERARGAARIFGGGRLERGWRVFSDRWRGGRAGRAAAADHRRAPRNARWSRGRRWRDRLHRASGSRGAAVSRVCAFRRRLYVRFTASGDDVDHALVRRPATTAGAVVHVNRFVAGRGHRDAAVGVVAVALVARARDGSARRGISAGHCADRVVRSARVLRALDRGRPFGSSFWEPHLRSPCARVSSWR